MLGLKQFENAASTIGGVELIHRIRQGQCALGRLRMSGTAAPEIWNAVLTVLSGRFKTPHRSITYHAQNLQQNHNPSVSSFGAIPRPVTIGVCA
jgi:hypothetical protein